MILEFHFHVYYEPNQRAEAESFRKEVCRVGGAQWMVSSLSDGPRGPHVKAMFGIHVPSDSLVKAMSFIMKNHGSLPVLFHPETGDDVRDHSDHAFWLGEKQPLDFSVFKPSKN
jgi:aromatic ring-cleaving dioxygenase